MTSGGTEETDVVQPVSRRTEFGRCRDDVSVNRDSGETDVVSPRRKMDVLSGGWNPTPYVGTVRSGVEIDVWSSVRRGVVVRREGTTLFDDKIRGTRIRTRR